MHYIILIVGFIFLGAFAGIMAGLLGIGGGLVVVPGLAYLYYYTAVPHNHLMQMAEGTSLAIMIPTTIRSLLAHLQRKAEVWPIFSKLLPSVIVGAILGALLAHVVNSKVLQILFGFFVLYMAVRLWFDSRTEAQGKLPGPVGLNIFGTIVGAKSGLLGIGGGVLTIPFLTRWSVPIRDSIAISNAVSFTVSIIGTLSFIISGLMVKGMPAWSTGYVYWPAWLPVALVSMIVAPWGVKLAHHLSPKILKRIFSIFLLMVAGQMLKILI
ncbi:MAG: sulfite exporter TauE/SafE family protein [Proteobacteria bacterium]|nr:sulfite exporter TauE/SafE family protein [Pseudomonadota bacterium]